MRDGSVRLKLRHKVHTHALARIKYLATDRGYLTQVISLNRTEGLTIGIKRVDSLHDWADSGVNPVRWWDGIFLLCQTVLPNIFAATDLRRWREFFRNESTDCYVDIDLLVGRCGGILIRMPGRP